MAKVFIEESTLTNIGDAIRAKTGDDAKLSPAAMVDAIGGITTGGDMNVPEEALVLTGDCQRRFTYHWDWFLDEYSNQMTTEGITNAEYMFNNCYVESIPFDFNFDNSEARNSSNMFAGCVNVKEIGTIRNFIPRNMNGMFGMCQALRSLPEFENLDTSYLNSGNGKMQSAFHECCSLRRIPEELLNKLYNPKANSYLYTFLYGTFTNCFSLDEIKGINPQSGTVTLDVFGSTFMHCYRAKEIVFATQDGGIPYVENWKGQTIDLTNYVGYASLRTPAFLRYDTGITEDDEVVDAADYAALKNSPDWFTADIAFSRYNHDSAVNTINSLPDTSAYLAEKGGTNTIKFMGESGSATDAGAINTLTEEEIAAATVKGWTVAFA